MPRCGSEQWYLRSRMDVIILNIIEINYSQLIQYEILEKLVTFMNDPLPTTNNKVNAVHSGFVWKGLGVSAKTKAPKCIFTTAPNQANLYTGKVHSRLSNCESTLSLVVGKVENKGHIFQNNLSKSWLTTAQAVVHLPPVQIFPWPNPSRVPSTFWHSHF